MTCPPCESQSGIFNGDVGAEFFRSTFRTQIYLDQRWPQIYLDVFSLVRNVGKWMGNGWKWDLVINRVIMHHSTSFPIHSHPLQHQFRGRRPRPFVRVSGGRKDGAGPGLVRQDQVPVPGCVARVQRLGASRMGLMGSYRGFPTGLSMSSWGYPNGSHMDLWSINMELICRLQTYNMYNCPNVERNYMELLKVQVD